MKSLPVTILTDQSSVIETCKAGYTLGRSVTIEWELASGGTQRITGHIEKMTETQPPGGGMWEIIIRPSRGGTGTGPRYQLKKPPPSGSDESAIAPPPQFA